MASNSEAAVGLPAVSAAIQGSRASELETEIVELFERHRSPLLRYLLSFGITASDAEEVVQDIFLTLFDHLRRGKSRANLNGWLFRVAHNRAIKRRVKAQRETAGGPEERVDASPGPEEQFIAVQRQARLLAVMNALPEIDRCCLSLRAEGLRYREIAGVLGISLGTVANSLARSLARLSRADER